VNNKLALIVAVVLGVLSIIGIRLYVDGIVLKYTREQEPVDCFVSAREIKPGRTFTVDDIVETQFPRQVLEAYKTSRITDKTTIIGARITQPIEMGQVLQTYHFATKNIIGKKLEFGKEYRAVTLPMSKITGVGGLLRPGDFVDLVVNMKLVDGGREVLGVKELPVALTLYKSVLVLATDQITDPSDADAGRGYSTVTLRLKPDEVNKVLFAQYNGGAIHLVQAQSGTGEYVGHNAVITNSIYNDVKEEIQAILQRD
jgi:pilus assembly protein CpaB